LLYDKIHRDDILAHAYALARANAGAAGADGRTFAAVEAMGLEGWLAAIRKDLVAKTYSRQFQRVAPSPPGFPRTWERPARACEERRRGLAVK
jgi:RNA-directed DNA polymerase